MSIALSCKVITGYNGVGDYYINYDFSIESVDLIRGKYLVLNNYLKIGNNNEFIIIHKHLSNPCQLIWFA